MENFSETQNQPQPSVPAENKTRIKIVGVGGAASRTVARLCSSKKIDATFVAMDTCASDLDALKPSGVKTVLIGESVVGGIGTGAQASLAARAAAESEETIREMLVGTDLLLLVTSLGRGTGSGASVEVLKNALSLGIVSICFATTPFSIEGADSTKQAMTAIDALHAKSNAFILIENNLIAQSVKNGGTFSEGFKISDRWLENGISACCRMLRNESGRMRVDFAAFKTLFPTVGLRTLFSIGSGHGENAQESALNELFHSPLLKTKTALAGASETLAVHIETGTDPQLAFINETAQRVQDCFGGEKRTLLSYAINPALGDGIEICVFGAAGNSSSRRHSPRQRQTKQENPAETNSDVLVLSPDFGERKDAPEVFGGDAENSASVSSQLFEGRDLDSPTYFRRGIKLDAEFEKKKKSFGFTPQN